MGKKRHPKNRLVRQPPAGPPSPRTRIVSSALETFSGPLPPPDALERYDQILPGSAERILAMAERQATHRHDLEKSALRNDAREARLGQILGFLIATIAIGAGSTVALYAPQTGGQIAGGLIGATGLATLVGVFVYGRKRAPEK